MAKLLIVRGIPGAGKSTLAQVAVAAGYTHLEDDMAHFNELGEYDYHWSRDQAAFDWLAVTTQRLLMHNQDVVVSSVFRTNSVIQPYKDFCDAHGHRFTIATLEANHGNIHDVPEKVLAMMKDEWEPLNLK